MNIKPVVVIGDGWAALGAAGLLTSSGLNVVWIAGSGSRMIAPLACLEHGPGVSIWAELATRLGIPFGESQSGSFIREFRNKAFREPAWTKAPNGEARKEVRDELLWEPERRLMGAFDSRFSLSLGEIEDEIRKALNSQSFPNLRRIEEVPVKGFKTDNQDIKSVVLGSGEEIECDQVIYADRWSLLLGMEGVPKPLPFLRNREPVGVLQASFGHEPALSSGVMESFYASVHKDAGEDIERHVWGYFSTDGKKSHWTLCLSSEQVEDNHEIAKKLRRMKSTLDKIFAGSSLIPSGKETMGASVVEEQVRFVEEALFSEGTPPAESITVPQLSGAYFLTDGYGPASSLHQVAMALGIDMKSANAQTESVDVG